MLVYGELVLTESVAIVPYLGEKYRGMGLANASHNPIVTPSGVPEAGRRPHSR